MLGETVATPMRFAHFTTLVSITVLMLGLTLTAGVASAADAQSLSAEDQAFLARAMSDDAAQIAMAQVALKRSTNQQVLSLANAIIRERTVLDNRLAQLMASGGMRATVARIEDGDTRLNTLQSLSGDAFDRTFTSMLVCDHYHILSAYQAIKASTSHIDLKNLAHETVPALRGDLTLALAYVRTENWKPSAHGQDALTAADSHGSKVPVYWESISIVAAPW